jgi:hypothetical protein
MHCVKDSAASSILVYGKARMEYLGAFLGLDVEKSFIK